MSSTDEPLDRDRAPQPSVYRVQRLSAERPGWPTYDKPAMTCYRKTAPCSAAVWNRKDQWWWVTLHTLLDLQDLQKEVGSTVALSSDVMTIQDESPWDPGYDCG